MALFALTLSACSGDAIVDVEQDPPDGNDPSFENKQPDAPAIPFFNLGNFTQVSSDPVGSGRSFVVTNGLIQVDGLTFASGFGIDGTMRNLNFFFGYGTSLTLCSRVRVGYLQREL